MTPFFIHFLFLALDFIPHPLNGALFLITVKTYIRDNGQKKERKVLLGGGGVNSNFSSGVGNICYWGSIALPVVFQIQI